VKEFSAWNEEMLNLLTIFIRILSKTRLAWDEFQAVDIGYFAAQDDDERMLYLQSISKSYSSLREKLDTLEALKLKLVDSNRYVVSVDSLRRLDREI
jgi:hypothetical protein